MTDQKYQGGYCYRRVSTDDDIKVVVGASSGTPEELVSAFLQNTLETGDNICDH